MTVSFMFSMLFVNIIAVLIAIYIWTVSNKYGWRWKWSLQEIQNFFKDNIFGIVALSLTVNLASTYIYNKCTQQDDDDKKNNIDMHFLPMQLSPVSQKNAQPVSHSSEPRNNNLIVSPNATSQPILQNSPSTSYELRKSSSHLTGHHDTKTPANPTKKIEKNIYKTFLKTTSCKNIRQITILFDEKIAITEPVSNIKNYIESQLRMHCFSATEDTSYPELIFYIKNNDYTSTRSPTSGIYTVSLTINAKGLHENYSGHGEKKSQSQQEANKAALKQAAEDIVDKISKRK